MNGIIVIDKPKEYTSHDIVAIVRGILNERHLGHTGTLDPNATGVLPICIGSATKLIEYMDDAKKVYECTCKLGISTDTQDIWGQIIKEQESDITEEKLISVIPEFIGDIEQVPSKYSAIRINGRRLYSYAHSGEEIDIPARKVTVYSLDLLGFDYENQEFNFRVCCSRGTYVRSICNDIGEKLNVGACLKELRRVSCSGYAIDEAVDFEELRKMNPEDALGLIRPMETAVSFMDRIDISEDELKDFSDGKHLKHKQGSIALNKDICVFCNDKLVGIALFDNPNRVRPRKVFVRQ